MSDPADDRLRRAARLLDDLRARTTGGRWETAGLLASRPEVVAWYGDGTGEHVAEARAGSAPWITALSPAMADPLMAWLDATAAGAADMPPAALDAALHFAAVLLDGVPGPHPT